MAQPSKTSTCARCASRLQERYRFCPECGLPVAGTGVLSTHIHEVMPKERSSREAKDWSRLLLPSGATLMLVLVVGMGLVLYNRELLDRVLPQPADPAHDGPAVAQSWEPEWIPIPPGVCPIGPPENPAEPWDNEHGFWMSRYEVTNAQWLEFIELAEDELRERGLWEDASPGPTGGWEVDEDRRPVLPPGQERNPVRNINLTIAIEYARWLTRRLGSDSEWVIRLPQNGEWEFAARGEEGRVYTWGDQFRLPAAPKTRRDPGPPPGIAGRLPLPVDSLTEDESPYGVVGMGTNVMEWALADGWIGPQALLTPRQGFKRGASFAVNDDKKGERVARTWHRPEVEARITQGDLGFRLVKVRRSTD